MALTLIKETGAGLANANDYANATDGDAYHDGHLYATAWTASPLGNKEAALVMATRLIDGQFQFDGVKATRHRRCNGRVRIAMTLMGMTRCRSMRCRRRSLRRRARWRVNSLSPTAPLRPRERA